MTDLYSSLKSNKKFLSLLKEYVGQYDFPSIMSRIRYAAEECTGVNVSFTEIQELFNRLSNDKLLESINTGDFNFIYKINLEILKSLETSCEENTSFLDDLYKATWLIKDPLDNSKDIEGSFAFSSYDVHNEDDAARFIVEHFGLDSFKLFKFNRLTNSFVEI